MNYKIIEVHIMYQENKIEEIAVLWQSNQDGSVRSSYMITEECFGYGHLEKGFTLSSELLQRVAGRGMNLPDSKKKLYFPGKRKWSR